jgi:aminoglycoside 3-N-acetyltransferase I
MNPLFSVKLLAADDVHLLRSMLALFGEAFEDPASYLEQQPSDEYLANLLSSDTFVAAVATDELSVVGGLAGYVLPKFEQARSEFYIYDLAVAAQYRRKGVATALIEQVGSVVAKRGVYVTFVQADYGDEAAIALYTKLGSREDVMHFDIAPPAAG